MRPMTTAPADIRAITVLRERQVRVVVPQDRIDYWVQQAWLCFKDDRFDLVEICLEELSAVAREAMP